MCIAFRAAALAAAILAVASSACRADRVDDLMRRELKSRHIPGASIAVNRDGKTVKAAAYGVANLEQSAPARPETVFQIQSMTKSFTAAGILMLVEDGKVALDDPLSKFLDGLPEAWNRIRIRHLLSHTSGIQDYINDPTQSLRLDVEDRVVLKAAAERPLNFTPGARYQYSNTNYLLLGMVIQKVTGQTWFEFLKQRILDPLGMAETRQYTWSDLVPHRAAGYVWSGSAWRNGEYYAPSVLGYPGGGLLSTARDIAKWDIALSEGRVLTEESRQRMWRPTVLNDGSTSAYGFGWSMGSVNGHPYQSHSGAHSSGFSSFIIRFPHDGLSVILLTNLAGVDTYDLCRLIAGQYVPGLLLQGKPGTRSQRP